MKGTAGYQFDFECLARAADNQSFYDKTFFKVGDADSKLKTSLYKCFVLGFMLNKCHVFKLWRLKSFTVVPKDIINFDFTMYHPRIEKNVSHEGIFA